MNLSAAYQEARQKAIQQGVQQGRLEERQGLVKSLLQARFGKIDKTLSTVIEPLVQCSPQEIAEWLLHWSREDLIAKFGKSRKVK